MINEKKDLSKEKWILLHKIPREDILEFIMKHEFEWFSRNLKFGTDCGDIRFSIDEGKLRR